MRISDWSSDVCSSDLQTPTTGNKKGRPWPPFSFRCWRPQSLASILVRRIEAVELAAQCRPLDLADRPIAALRVVEAVALDGGALHFLGDRVQLCARLLARALHVAGTLGPVHPHEGLARRAADREEAGVAHDQHYVVAEVRSEERRVGQECVSTWKSRWSTVH